MRLFLAILFACSVSPSKVIQRDIVEQFPDLFIDLNFFHVYFLQLPNIPNWKAYIRYHLISDQIVAKAFKTEHSLDEKTLNRLGSSRELEYAKSKVLKYEIPLKKAKAPKIPLQAVEANRFFILDYISYYIDVIPTILSVSLTGKTEAEIFNEITNRNEMLFWDCYFAWLAIYRNFEMFWSQSLKLLTVVREIGQNWAVCSIYKSKIDKYPPSIYVQSGHLFGLTKYRKEPDQVFFYVGIFGKLNANLNKIISNIQDDVYKLLLTYKGNNEKVRGDIKEFEIFKKLLEIIKLDLSKSSAQDVHFIISSIFNQIRSLLGPLQKYIPEYAPKPKSIDHLFAQLVNESRFLQRVQAQGEYPPDLFRFVVEAFERKLESFKALLNSLRSSSDRTFILFYSDSIKNFPSIQKEINYKMDLAPIYDPQDIKANIMCHGIPDNSITSFPSIPTLTDEISSTFSIVSGLAAGFAYRLFSKLYAYSVKADNMLFANLKPEDRQKKIETFIRTNYLQCMSLGDELIEKIDSEAERCIIKRYLEMVHRWIMTKCYYFFYEDNTANLWKKLGNAFAIPISTPSGWFNVELGLWENSDDPDWKKMQFKYLTEFGVTTDNFKALKASSSRKPTQIV